MRKAARKKGGSAPRRVFLTRLASTAVLAPLFVHVLWKGGALYTLTLLALMAVSVHELFHMAMVRKKSAAGGAKPLLSPWLGGAFLYILVAGAALLWLRHATYGIYETYGAYGAERGACLLLWLAALVWSNDSAAYGGGRFFGGRRLFPAISPNKTWAGLISGLAAGMISSLAFVRLWVEDAALASWMLAMTLPVLAAAHAGDALESMLKRHYNAKDSGNLIPGHGGALDRCDSFYGAGLAAAFAFAVVPA